MKTNTSFLDQIIQNRLLSHLLFWLVLLGTTTYLASLEERSFYHHLINNLGLLPAQMMAAYCLAYYQVPQLILKKRYWTFIFSMLASIFVFSVIARLMIIYLAEPFIRTDFEQESIGEILGDLNYLLAVYFPAVYLFPMVLLTIKMVKERFEERHQLEVLQKEKTTAELNFLKAQIHPHFLFNTLNNLYSLTLDKSEAAPEVVVKLSEMLDYMLYQCSDPKVPLTKEVALIQNYIDLEMLRYGDQMQLEFHQAIDQPEAEIAPLILVSIVENAFKHGASGNLVDPTIKINLAVQNNQLKFEVFNTKPNPITAPKVTLKKGVGSNNIQRQLDLIYPEQFKLHIDDQATSYSLILEIDL